jgi:hypothetical protein
MMHKNKDLHDTSFHSNNPQITYDFVCGKINLEQAKKQILTEPLNINKFIDGIGQQTCSNAHFVHAYAVAHFSDTKN